MDEVTKQMKRAGYKAYFDIASKFPNPGENLDNFGRRAIDAALTAAENARKAPVVKPLEWTPWTGSASYAHSAIGDYSVDRDEDENMAATPYVTWGQDENLGHHPTLEIAQSSAQADYQQRILSALSTLPQQDDLRKALDTQNESLRYIAKQWPETSAGKHARAAIRALAGGE